MVDQKQRAVSSVLGRIVPRLKYPQLFIVILALFLIDLVVPDPIPLMDEVMLGLLTILLGTWKTRRPAEDRASPKDVTDRGSDDRA